MRTFQRAAAAAALLGLVAFGVVNAASSKVAFPDPQVDDPLAGAPDKVTLVLAGGCFWGIEEVFQHVRGVTDAVSGYAGGSVKNPSYEMVSLGTTGHAESVRVTYDPSKISYGRLLKIFFSVAHDPTQRGGQGPDTGPQYRSVIFSAGERQQEIARAYIEQLTSRARLRRAGRSRRRSRRWWRSTKRRRITRTTPSTIRRSPISSSTTSPRSMRCARCSPSCM